MADVLSKRPRPTAVRDDQGLLRNPDGWSLLILAADAETVVCAWDDAERFHQWEPTEAIVRQQCDALAQLQVALSMERQ